MEQEITGGYLTKEIIDKALDGLWNAKYREPWYPPGYSRYRGIIKMIELPDEDWTVSSGGWKLVIRNGAMKGLVRE